MVINCENDYTSQGIYLATYETAVEAASNGKAVINEFKKKKNGNTFDGNEGKRVTAKIEGQCLMGLNLVEEGQKGEGTSSQ